MIQLLREHSFGFYQLLFKILPSLDNIDSFIFENRSNVVFPSNKFLFWTNIKQIRGNPKEIMMRNMIIVTGYMTKVRLLLIIRVFTLKT